MLEIMPHVIVKNPGAGPNLRTITALEPLTDRWRSKAGHGLAARACYRRRCVQNANGYAMLISRKNRKQTRYFEYD
ncbi:hypothetical protein J2Z17_001991 [Rhizobium halophytocola]|uniref:Uncharacterized protein n=1 Tax=Rhizobium halophytocola TaxID=735519 RepID=A0ABS4DXY3_9HYPH|nr:hypothetical protein [Rhizobium halophytocola]